MGEIFREMLAEAEARRNDMTTEKQTPEALAAECKRLAEEAVTAHRRDGMLRQTKLGPVAVSALHAAIDRLAALASAQARQEPACWYCGGVSGQECQRPFDDEPCRRTAPPVQQEPIGTPDSLAEELHRVLTDPDSSLSDGARRSVDFVIHALRLRAFNTAPPVQQAEPQALTDAEPMQPLAVDERGVMRFKRNAIVDWLYEHGARTGHGLNEIAELEFTDSDRRQFAQLIGYSLDGYGDLSYVDDASYERAAIAATKKDLRDGTGASLHGRCRITSASRQPMRRRGSDGR